MIETRRTIFAYSAGGHRAELERAVAGISFTRRIDVTYRSGRAADRSTKCVHFLCHPRRSAWRTGWNAIQAAWLLVRVRPRLIVSTGADVAVPLCILGKLMGAQLVYVETAGQTVPTLTGRLVHRFADLFVVQWEEQRPHYPDAVLARAPLL